MNPMLEVNPSACVFVVGPQISARCAKAATKQPPLGYRAIVKAAIRAVEGTSHASAASEDKDKKHKQNSLKEVYERDPALAIREAVEILKLENRYEEWLNKTFAVELRGPEANPDSNVTRLLELQRRGALLACTQYDTLLDAMAGTVPITLEDQTTVQEWASGKVQGFLHLHGVWSQPDSLQLEGASCEKLFMECKPQSTSLTTTRDIFRKRLVIFIGFDAEDADPHLPELLRALYPDDSVVKPPPILLTAVPDHQYSSLFLQLRISKEETGHLEEMISAGSEKNFAIGKGLEKPSDCAKVQAFLLFDEKQSFRKLGDIIYQQSKSGEIYVRRDALTVIFGERILYGNLVTYGGNGLKQLWKLVFAEDSPLRSKGLVALGLQNAAIVWTKRKPQGLGNVTGINSVHTYSMSRSLQGSYLQQSHPQPRHSADPAPSRSASSLASPLVTSPPFHFYPTGAVANPQLTSPVLVGNGPLISPGIFSLGADTKSCIHLQMVVQGQGITQSSQAAQVNQYFSTIPLREAKFCVATPAASLSLISSRVPQLEGESYGEHTVQYIDQLPVNQIHPVKRQRGPRNAFSSHNQASSTAKFHKRGLREKEKLHSNEEGRDHSSKHTYPTQQPIAPKTPSDCGPSSGSPAKPDGSNLPKFSKPLSKRNLTTSTAPLQAGAPTLLSDHGMFVTPQAYASQALPLVYSPSFAQPLSCYMLALNPYASSQPMLLAAPSLLQGYPVATCQAAATPSPLQPIVYMLSDNTVTQGTQSHTQNESLETPPSRSPANSPLLPPSKRRKRSASLPDILQPATSRTESTVASKDDYGAFVIKKPSDLKGPINHTALPPLHSSSDSFVSECARTSDQEQDTESGRADSPPSDLEEANTTAVSVGEETSPGSFYKGHSQLWEFLLDLLLSPNHGSIIQWTGNGYEFHIVNPEAVAHLWGAHKNKPKMTYEKLSRALRYYYSRGIMERVPGNKLHFKFSFDIQKYILNHQMRISQLPVV